MLYYIVYVSSNMRIYAVGIIPTVDRKPID